MYFKRRTLKEHTNANISFLIRSNLASYFKAISIIVPGCLLNSSTIIKNRNTNSLIFIARYLMNAGLLSKTLKYLNFSLLALLSETSLISFSKSRLAHLRFASTENLKKIRIIKKYVSKTDVFSNLNSKLLSLKPIFHYYIYKVDKQIYKNSRGKSGKYTFIWKYVAPFKRVNFITFNLSKEVKSDYSKNIVSRIVNCLTKYLKNPRSSMISRSIRFSNNYVFIGGKSILLQKYRTIKSS